MYDVEEEIKDYVELKKINDLIKILKDKIDELSFGEKTEDKSSLKIYNYRIIINSLLVLREYNSYKDMDEFDKLCLLKKYLVDNKISFEFIEGGYGITDEKITYDLLLKDFLPIKFANKIKNIHDKYLEYKYDDVAIYKTIISVYKKDNNIKNFFDYINKYTTFKHISYLKNMKLFFTKFETLKEKFNDDDIFVINEIKKDILSFREENLKKNLPEIIDIIRNKKKFSEYYDFSKGVINRKCKIDNEDELDFINSGELDSIKNDDDKFLIIYYLMDNNYNRDVYHEWKILDDLMLEESFENKLKKLKCSPTKLLNLINKYQNCFREEDLTKLFIFLDKYTFIVKNKIESIISLYNLDKESAYLELIEKLYLEEDAVLNNCCYNNFFEDKEENDLKKIYGELKSKLHTNEYKLNVIKIMYNKYKDNPIMLNKLNHSLYINVNFVINDESLSQEDKDNIIFYISEEYKFLCEINGIKDFNELFDSVFGNTSRDANNKYNQQCSNNLLHGLIDKYSKFLSQDDIFMINSLLLCYESKDKNNNYYIDLINSYLKDNSHSLEEFCIKKNIRDKVLYNAIETARKSNPELYKNFKEKEGENKLYLKKNIALVAVKPITDYINAKYKNKEDYCKDKKIDIGLFNKYIDLIKTFDPLLYEKYVAKQKGKTAQRYVAIVAVCKKIINGIKNGVELEDGSKREFDILDYYILTKLPYDKMFDLIKSDLNSSDARTLKTFFSKNKIENPYSGFQIKKIYETRCEINLKSDSSGNIIIGSGRLIKLEEKKAIVKYLLSNNIPVTGKTYNCVLKRYLNNKIQLNINYNLDNDDIKKI